MFAYENAFSLKVKPMWEYNQMISMNLEKKLKHAYIRFGLFSVTRYWLTQCCNDTLFVTIATAVNVMATYLIKKQQFNPLKNKSQRNPGLFFLINFGLGNIEVDSIYICIYTCYPLCHFSPISSETL